MWMTFFFLYQNISIKCEKDWEAKAGDYWFVANTTQEKMHGTFVKQDSAFYFNEELGIVEK